MAPDGPVRISHKHYTPPKTREREMKHYAKGEWLPSGFRVGQCVVLSADMRDMFAPPYEGIVISGARVTQVTVRRLGRASETWHPDCWGDAP